MKVKHLLKKMILQLFFMAVCICNLQAATGSMEIGGTTIPDLAQDDSGTGWKWMATSNTLELSGTYTGGKIVINCADSDAINLAYSGDVSMTSWIRCAGSLQIDGSLGTLSIVVNIDNNAIIVQGTLTINSGTINATSIIDNGPVIVAVQGVHIQGAANVSAIGTGKNSIGIQSLYNIISISTTGTVTAKATGNSYALGGPFNITINISSGTVITGGEGTVGDVEGNLTVSGGTADVTTNGDILGNLTVNDGTVVYTGTVGGTTTHTGGTINGNSPPVASTDATLADLTVSEGTLTPAFSASVTSYTVDVESSVNQITINATANDGNASISGDTGTQTLIEGDNTFNILVTAEDETTTETYTVVVTRTLPPPPPVLSSDATLWSLTVNQGTLTPAFSDITTEYTVTVDGDIDEIVITAIANHGNAGVAGTGSMPLHVGTNLFYIEVTAEDGTIKTYTVTVIRGNTVGIEDINTTSIKIYQANGILYIESPEYIEDIRLYDMSGSLAFRQANAGNAASVSTLPKGIYVLTLVTTKGETVRKIVKE